MTEAKMRGILQQALQLQGKAKGDFMDVILLIGFFVLLGIDALLRRANKVAQNSNHLLYKYQLLSMHRRYKSGQYSVYGYKDTL
jgi:hypothetical protein